MRKYSMGAIGRVSAAHNCLILTAVAESSCSQLMTQHWMATEANGAVYPWTLLLFFACKPFFQLLRLPTFLRHISSACRQAFGRSICRPAPFRNGALAQSVTAGAWAC